MWEGVKANWNTATEKKTLHAGQNILEFQIFICKSFVKYIKQSKTTA